MISEDARDEISEQLPTICSIQDVAKFLRVTQLTVRRMIWDGELDAYHSGKEWEINRTSVIAYWSRHSNL